MKDYHMPMAYCPKCHSQLNGATPTEDDTGKPEEGDITFCMYCGAILVYTKEMSLRLMEESEVDDLPHDVVHRLATALPIINEMIKVRAREKAERN